MRAEETRAVCSEDGNLLINLDLQEVEARSNEGTDRVFEQLNDIEGYDSPGSSVVESESLAAEYSDFIGERLHKPIDDIPGIVGSQEPKETSSDFHLSNARLPEDVDAAPKLASEDTMDKLLKAEVKDGPIESESNEVDVLKGD